MKMKKINAVLGLLSILFMVLHIGYSVFAYLTFYYNPVLKMVFAYPFMVLMCLHAVCGMLTIFTMKDGSMADLYPKQNMGTILQRAGAALIFPLLILHINTFSLMRASAERGWIIFIVLLIAAELLFFGAVITHVVISFSRGLITLGLLTSEQAVRKLDRFMYAAGAVCFVISVFAVVKGQIAMFLGG